MPSWVWIGLFVLFVIALRAEVTARRTRKARARIDPDQALDAAFNGASPVTVEVGPETLDAGTYLAGATARGYRLEAQQGNVLVFVSR